MIHLSECLLQIVVLCHLAFGYVDEDVFDLQDVFKGLFTCGRLDNVIRDIGYSHSCSPFLDLVLVASDLWLVSPCNRPEQADMPRIVFLPFSGVRWRRS